MKRIVTSLVNAAKASPDLLKRPWKPVDGNPLAGHCYIVCEALRAVYGDLKPCVIRHHGGTHWFLKNNKGKVIDPTAEQFADSVPYDQGKGCGFLTREPSKRARELLRRAGFRD